MAGEPDPNPDRNPRDENSGRGAAWQDFLDALAKGHSSDSPTPQGSLKAVAVSVFTGGGLLASAMAWPGLIERMNPLLVFGLAALAVMALFISKMDRIIAASGPFWILAAIARKIWIRKGDISETELTTVAVAVTGSSASEQSASELREVAAFFSSAAPGLLPADGSDGKAG